MLVHIGVTILLWRSEELKWLKAPTNSRRLGTTCLYTVKQAMAPQLQHGAVQWLVTEPVFI